MKVVNIDIPEDHGYLIPIGDLHRGDRHFGTEGYTKLKGYLAWVMERPNAYIFLMGDILNVASRSSATNPFESDSGDHEYAQAVELFKPVASRIIGAITGNHELRMSQQFGFNPLQPFCNELGVPFLGYSACIRVRVGKETCSKSNSKYNQLYWGYAHHGTGGGATLGGALNRKLKLSEVVQGVDFVMAGHDHQLITGVREYYLPLAKRVTRLRTYYIDTGHYLDWDDSYVEEKHLPIGKMGSPRIRFDGRRGRGQQNWHKRKNKPSTLETARNCHDIHVSI